MLVFRKVTLEPILFLLNVASYVVWVTSQDLMMKKACLVNYHYSNLICEDLNSHSFEQGAVQYKVSSFIMWKSILETCLKIVTVPILGCWSDKVGSKWPLIVCLVFLSLESGVLLLNTLMKSWPLEAILASGFIYGFSGGVHGLLMLAFSLMAQRTSLENRTLRIGILDGFYYLGSPVGLALAPFLFNYSGHAGIFIGAIGLYIVAVLYVICRISNENSNQEGNSERTDESSLYGLELCISAIRTTFKERPDKARSFILICIFVMLLDSFVVWGENNVKYLFVQRALNWNYTNYSFFSSFSSLCSVFGALVIVPILTLRSFLSDPVIGLIGSISRVVERIFYSLATNPGLHWLMYVGGTAGIASALVPIGIRSFISKLANDEVGKVYSVMAVGETILPFCSSPVYNSLYKTSLNSFPGAFYLLSLLLNALMSSCFVIIISCQRMRRYSETEL